MSPSSLRLWPISLLLVTLGLAAAACTADGPLQQAAPAAVIEDRETEPAVEPTPAPTAATSAPDATPTPAAPVSESLDKDFDLAGEVCDFRET